MFVSIYYKPSLFNAHTLILIVHIFMNVNKFCLNQGDYIYLWLHCYHQNDYCIKVGSDERHFNVSLIVRDKVTRQCPQTTMFEEKGEPKLIRTEVPLLATLTPYL